MVNTITYGLPASYYTSQYRTPEASNPHSYAADSERTARDTLEISEDGQKIINLTRGAELSAQLPDASADRAAFDAALERAQVDIKRITTLFSGVLNLVAESQPRFSEDDQSLSAAVALDPDITTQLHKAFEDIRQISAEVGHRLQQRRFEFD